MPRDGIGHGQIQGYSYELGVSSPLKLILKLKSLMLWANSIWMWDFKMCVESHEVIRKRPLMGLVALYVEKYRLSLKHLLCPLVTFLSHAVLCLLMML